MIRRHITDHAQYCLKQFKAICLIGPRQSGKTTLSKQLLDAPYVNFENPSTEAALLADPEGFLGNYRKGAIFDEVQRVPILLRALQQVLDDQPKKGRFILTGSQQLLLLDGVTQSLAGRVGYLNLLPLSFGELSDAGMEGSGVAAHILKGGYPEIWANGADASLWLNSYIQTYIERDVRSIRNITNLQAFLRFLQLCANAAGQMVNREELGRQAGVDAKTADAWLGLLEASFITFTLKPWFNNQNKRIVKSPKLYFHDTGLLCELLNIRSQKALLSSAHYGAIFENWIAAEVLKNRANLGNRSPLYYLRDRTGNEVDLLFENDGVMRGFEIKSATKVKDEMFKSIVFWQRMQRQDNGALIYGGNASSGGVAGSQVLPWRDVRFLA